MSTPSAAENNHGTNEKLLFWGCFIALIATAFGFVVRGQVMNDWGTEFGLTETEKGEIFGVGLWPFAVSIVLFSLIVDHIGYGKAMVFAFVCHAVSAVVTIWAPYHFNPYWSLYWGTFIVALGNGTVEAVINPVVATMFSREKTKWLNILHAGWPGGLVLGGILAIAIGNWHWTYKVALIFIPMVLYGLMLVGRRFPVHERVAAGVSYRAMLQEVGIGGCLIVTALIVFEVTRIFAEMGVIFADGAPILAGAAPNVQLGVKLGLIAAVTAVYGAYARSIGRPMFIFLLLIMIPLATTELGTDSWITPLMESQMKQMDLHPGWVLVYTSLIMMILRFYAGPIVHRLSPLGLLAVSSLVAACGLIFLSKAAGLAILAAATIYGFGKTFFWPTMLGVTAERFPKGGALTLNAVGGVGMLGVGVVGAPLLGYIQDTRVEQQLAVDNRELHQQLVMPSQQKKLMGIIEYQAADKDREALLRDRVALYEHRQKVQEQLGEGQSLDEALREDREYLRLLRVAYGHWLKTQNRQDVDADNADYDTIVGELEKAQFFVTESQYESLKRQVDELDRIVNDARKRALASVAVFPVIMLVCYLALILYFRAQGGYQAEMLAGGETPDEEKMTGGVEGPVE